MAKKATAAEIEKRIEQVYSLLLLSEPTKTIYRYCSDKWGISTRQADVYIQRATVFFREQSIDNREDRRNRAIEQRNMVFREAFRRKHLQTAYLVLQDRDTLDGLYFSESDHIEELLKRGYIVTRPEAEPETGTADAANADAKEGDAAVQEFFEGDQDIGTPHNSEEGISG